METYLEKDLRLPKIGKALLSKRPSIGMKEFEKECAYWLMGFIEELRWKPSPTEPEEIETYNARRRNDKTFTLPISFWQQSHIRAYTAMDLSIRCQNQSSWYWLCFLKSYIQANDLPNHKKIAVVMDGYPRSENQYVVNDEWQNR